MELVPCVCIVQQNNRNENPMSALVSVSFCLLPLGEGKAQRGLFPFHGRTESREGEGTFLDPGTVFHMYV